MRTTRFTFPSGGPEVPEPSEGFLRDVIFHRDEEFWQGGSGTGGLQYSKGDFHAQLVLTMKEAHGFFVFYSKWGEGDEYVATLGGQSSQTTVVHFGGDPRTLADHYFIPRERAWEAVQEFCRTGKRVEGLNWVVYDPPEPA